MGPARAKKSAKSRKNAEQKKLLFNVSQQHLNSVSGLICKSSCS